MFILLQYVLYMSNLFDNGNIFLLQNKVAKIIQVLRKESHVEYYLSSIYIF
jgi:hypothetical protein